MLTRKQAEEIGRICPTTRNARFGKNGPTAISVANHDRKRPEIAKILDGQEPLWERGSYQSGMILWVYKRDWYPYE
jgi:hypothetical protein